MQVQDKEESILPRGSVKKKVKEKTLFYNGACQNSGQLLFLFEGVLLGSLIAKRGGR